MRFFYFILSHSIFVSICAVALCFQTALLFHINLSWYLYFFVFFATLCSYNFYWLLSGYTFAKHSFYFALKKYKTNVIIFFISALAIVFCLFHLTNLLPAIFVGILLTILYSIPVLPFKVFYKTRKVGLLKTFLLAFTWAFITVYIPYRQANNINKQLLILLLINRFFFMLLLCIIFDARDTAIDKIRGLQSITTTFFPATIKYMMYSIFTLYIINGIIFRIYYKQASQILPLLITGAATAIVYYFSLKKQNYFFYYFIVDGLMLFSLITTFFATIC